MTPSDESCPLTENEAQSLFASVPPEATLVGGMAISWWADHYGLEFRDEDAVITKDVDLLGEKKTLATISHRWGGRVYLMPERSISSLIGQVHKETDEGPSSFMNVDVIHKVFGLSTEEVVKNRVAVESGGHTFYVLHPLHVAETRLHNLAGIQEKQSYHGASQAELGLRIARAYLDSLAQESATSSRASRTLSNGLNRLAKLACHPRLQGAAKAWALDVLSAFPIDTLKKVNCESFLVHQWPRIVAAAEAVAPSSNVGGPNARLPHSPRHPRM